MSTLTFKLLRIQKSNHVVLFFAHVSRVHVLVRPCHGPSLWAAPICVLPSAVPISSDGTLTREVVAKGDKYRVGMSRTVKYGESGRAQDTTFTQVHGMYTKAAETHTHIYIYIYIIIYIYIYIYTIYRYIQILIYICVCI